MALNVNREKGFTNAKIRIEGSGAVEEWNCLTGERHLVPTHSNGGYLELTTDFPASGERVYILTPQKTPNVAVKPMYKEVKRTSCDGPFEYALDEPNICVLDRAEYRLNGGPWQDGNEILKIDRAVRTKLGLYLRGGEMLQPWFAGKQVQTVKANLELRFQFAIEAMPKDVSLLVERPELFQIKVNGKNLSPSDADGWMIDACLKRIPIPDRALKTGDNRIELKIGFHEGINLEAIYLTGPFGIRIEGTKCALIRLPERLRLGSVTDQGLPFYSGRIQYALPALDAPKNGMRMILSAPDFEGACIQVKTPDAKPKTIAWPPYETDITDFAGSKLVLETVLTRRNTFGPLHQIPLKTAAYGPGNWITEGKSFSDNYMLYPAGLLKAPIIKTVRVSVD